MHRMKNYYTNWNTGYTKNGKQKTFDFKYDAKTAVARSDVESMIDQFSCAGISEKLNELYIGIQNATMRHINHSGPKYPNNHGSYTSSKDRCAVKTTIIDKTKKEEKKKKWEDDRKREKYRVKFISMFTPVNEECRNLYLIS